MDCECTRDAGSRKSLASQCGKCAGAHSRLRVPPVSAVKGNGVRMRLTHIGGTTGNALLVRTGQRGVFVFRHEP